MRAYVDLHSMLTSYFDCQERRWMNYPLRRFPTLQSPQRQGAIEGGRYSQLLAHIHLHLRDACRVKSVCGRHCLLPAIQRRRINAAHTQVPGPTHNAYSALASIIWEENHCVRVCVRVKARVRGE